MLWKEASLSLLSFFFYLPLNPWYQDQEIQPAFNVGLNSVLPYVPSPFGHSYWYNNYVPSGSFLSGGKLVSRDKGVPLTSEVFSLATS